MNAIGVRVVGAADMIVRSAEIDPVAFDILTVGLRSANAEALGNLIALNGVLLSASAGNRDADAIAEDLIARHGSELIRRAADRVMIRGGDENAEDFVSKIVLEVSVRI